MKERKYLLKDKVYFLKQCTYEDIPSHLERVSSYWEQMGMTLPALMEDKLKKSVKGGYAYKVVSEDTGECMAFLYLERIDVGQFFCTTMYMVRKVYIAMIFRYLKRINTRYLFFVPVNHLQEDAITNIPFRNMLSDMEIRIYQATKKYIKIDMNSKQSNTFYKYNYERLGVEEVTG